MTYRLSRHARDHYDQEIVTDPPIVAWEASFDGGTTWQAGEALAPGEPDRYRWLIAGDLADEDPPVAAAVLQVGDHEPLARGADGSRIVVRPLENIRVE